MRIALLKSKGLVCDPELASDGGSLRVAQEIQALLRAGHEVVCFTDLSFEGMEAPSSNLRVVRLPIARGAGAGDRLAGDLRHAAAFAQELVREPLYSSGDFDVVHAHHWSSIVDPELVCSLAPILR